MQVIFVTGYRDQGREAAGFDAGCSDYVIKPVSPPLVRAVIGLARSFQLTVIAEGVESIAHGERLIELGCDLAQGYGIARPMPADAVPDWANNYVAPPQWRAAKYTEDQI